MCWGQLTSLSSLGVLSHAADLRGLMKVSTSTSVLGPCHVEASTSTYVLDLMSCVYATHIM